MGILVSLFCLCLLSLSSNAETINVAPGQSIQNAILTAQNGDVIQLEAGEYLGGINYSGKRITIQGVGEETIIRGTGTAPVVFFINGETEESVLDQVMITGGVNQGAIVTFNSSPVVKRCTITGNTAISGNTSALDIQGRDLENDSPLFSNNIISRNKALINKASGVDAINILDSSPSLINNTIVRNQNNAIVVEGNSAPVLENNLIALNGTTRNGSRRGRALILDGASAQNDSTVKYNLFFDNGSKEVLARGVNGRQVWDYAYGAEQDLTNSKLTNNVDGNPKFQNLSRSRFDLTTNSPGLDKGDPADEFTDSADSSRNDIGASGGPEPHPNFVE